MVNILDVGCKFVEKLRREYACFYAGQMKLTPTLILLLNTLLYGNNLQQIFIANYWHALPAAICNIGVAIYLERHPEVQKCLNRFLSNDLAKVVSEALILWAILTATSFTWMFTQGAIYRSVRMFLTKVTPPPPAPLAILWQPEPSWREFTAHNSDFISLVVTLVMSSFVLVMGLVSTRNYFDTLGDAWSWITSTDYPHIFPSPWAQPPLLRTPEGREVDYEPMEEELSAEGLWTWEAMKRAPWMLSAMPPPPLPDFIPQQRDADDMPAAHHHVRRSSPAAHSPAASEWKLPPSSVRQPSLWRAAPAAAPAPAPAPTGAPRSATARHPLPATANVTRRVSSASTASLAGERSRATSRNVRHSSHSRAS